MSPACPDVRSWLIELLWLETIAAEDGAKDLRRSPDARARRHWFILTLVGEPPTPAHPAHQVTPGNLAGFRPPFSKARLRVAITYRIPCVR